jgi:hypothetical protein
MSASTKFNNLISQQNKIVQLLQYLRDQRGVKSKGGEGPDERKKKKEKPENLSLRTSLPRMPDILHSSPQNSELGMILNTVVLVW